jgi:hypothetical protein
MQPHRVPPPRDDKAARAHLQANIEAAADASLDPGHWPLHHIALPGGPGDFTPYQAPEYAEHSLWPFGEWLEALADVLGPDHAQCIARRGLEAGQ